MPPLKLVTPVSGDLNSATQSLVGLGALAAELGAQGVSVRDLFARTGVTVTQLEDVHARISHSQRLAIYRNAIRLAKRPDIGLLAGARQRISDYGIFGYAMVSSKTFGDALMFSLDHVTMAGPAVRQISFSIDGTIAILRSHGLDTLGELLPFAGEFWRSSMTSLFSRVLEAPFPSTRMIFPFGPRNTGATTNACSIARSTLAPTAWNGISRPMYLRARARTQIRSRRRSANRFAILY